MQHAGDVVDVADDEASRMIAAGQAEARGGPIKDARTADAPPRATRAVREPVKKR